MAQRRTVHLQLPLDDGRGEGLSTREKILGLPAVVDSDLLCPYAPRRRHEDGAVAVLDERQAEGARGAMYA